MSRAIGVGGILDIRSLATHQDLELSQKHWHDETTTEYQRKRYYLSTFFNNLSAEDRANHWSNFDRPKHWFHCVSATVISVVIFGILHSVPLLLPHIRVSLQMGVLEATVITGVTYAFVFCFSPLAAVVVRCAGNRLTCIFGLLLVFIGLAVDAFELHVMAFYFAHLVCIGIGSAFSLTAAMTSVSRHFRKELGFALAVISSAAPIGTVCFHYFFYIIASHTALSYKWFMVTVAILVLVTIGLTPSLPKSTLPARHPNPFVSGNAIGNHEFRDCLTEVSNEIKLIDRVDCDGNPLPFDEDEEKNRKACLCVCVCDVSSLSDLPFLIWVCVSSCAVITIYVPYVTLLWYGAATFTFTIEEGMYLILWLSVASLIGRGVVILSRNHTFFFNRTIFQVGIVGSAVLYSALSVTSTFGWFCVWCLVVGFCEGLLVGSIPRLTLMTIPRKYTGYCWVYLVFSNGIAAIIGPYLIVATRQLAGDITMACVAIGIIQFCGAGLSIFLPNEEWYEEGYEDEYFTPEMDDDDF